VPHKERCSIRICGSGYGAAHASESEAADRAVHAAAQSAIHAECVAALNTEVARLRAERPAVIEAWADAHDAVLADFIARKANATGNSLDATGVSVADGERTKWAAVKRGELAFVDENGFYVHSDPGAYRAIFGFDL